MLLRSMQNTQGLADAKAENDALRDDVAAGRRRLHQNGLSVSAWSHHRLGVDNAASPLADTAEQDNFLPSEGWSHHAKTTGRTQSILMSSADRVAHIDGQLMQLLAKQYTRFQRV